MATNRPTAPPPPGAAKGGTLLHSIGGRKPTVLLGGGAAVLVALYALYKRSSNANAGGSAPGTAATPTNDSSLTDFENEFENQIEALQAQLAGQQPTTPTVPTVPSAGHPVILGGAPPMGVGKPVRAAPAAAPSHTQAVVTVQNRNTLSGIAAKFGETWQQVWAYNLQPGVRSAATDKVLQKRGPNLLYPGEQILIPKK